MALRIFLTGGVAIETEAEVFQQDAFPGRQGLLMFSHLMWRRGTAVSRDALAELLWQHGQPRAWDTALNAIASKLRVLLARAGLQKSLVLPAALGCYQLNVPVDTWVDVDAARDSLHAAEGCLKAGQYDAGWSAAHVACHIFRRPFMVGESGPWVEQARALLTSFHVRACDCLAESCIRNNEPHTAIEVASEAIVAHPYRETSYQLLMRAHAAAGNRAEALRAYEQCRQLLAEELGVAPSAETQAVHLTVLQAR